MNRNYFLAIFLFAFISVLQAQVSLEERLKQHVYTLADDSLLGRAAGTEFAKKAAVYIAAQWDETGLSPLKGDSYYMPFHLGHYQNLAAIVEGNDPLLKDEYIIVGAHYDHLGVYPNKKGETLVFNGADDNASGVATLIELGRLLKERQHDLRRSIVLIAFDAEELGLFGSNEFIRNPPFPVDKIKLMMSIDMVGWYKKSGYVSYSGTGTFINGKSLLFDEALKPDGLLVKTQKFERSLFTGTDTKGFAVKGIPTLAVTTGTKSPYHKPEDMAHLIDYEGMSLITEHLVNFIQAVSKDDDFKTSGKIAPKYKTTYKMFTFGTAVNVGANHHAYTAGALNGKSATSMSVGLNGQYNMKFLAVRPEVFYDFVAARHPQGTITTHAITVPLNLLLQSPASLSNGAAIFAGPYYSYKLKGMQNSVQLDFDNMFNRDEVGLNWGLELWVFNFRLGFTSRSALTNFSRIKNADGAHIRYKTFYVTLGYVF